MKSQSSNFSRLKFAVWFFGGIVGCGLLSRIAEKFFNENTYALISFLLVLALSIVLIYPIVRRLQDIGQSGWWALLLYTPINIILILALLLVPRKMKMVIFKGVNVSYQAIVATMNDFDSQYPNTNDYDSWLDKDNFKFAVEYTGKLYPPKYILSQATRIDKSMFGGGKEANRVFRQLGFRVINKP